MIYSLKPSVECPWKDSYGVLQHVVQLLLYHLRLGGAAILTSHGGFFSASIHCWRKGPCITRTSCPLEEALLSFWPKGLKHKLFWRFDSSLVRLDCFNLCASIHQGFLALFICLPFKLRPYRCIFSHLKFCLAYECLSRQFAKLPGTLWPISSTILAWKFVAGNFWTSSFCRNE